MIDQATLKAKFPEIRPLLNERQLRLVSLAEAKFLGHGGIKSVSEVCGLSRRSIEWAKVGKGLVRASIMPRGAWLQRCGVV